MNKEERKIRKLYDKLCWKIERGYLLTEPKEILEFFNTDFEKYLTKEEISKILYDSKTPDAITINGDVVEYKLGPYQFNYVAQAR
jgi:hypothetical protein